MLRTLFVHDEPLGRQGVMRFMSRKPDWSIHFADGKTSALDKLEFGVYDAIVTGELRGGVEGHQLLQACLARWPSIARVLIVGAVPAPEAVTAAHAFMLAPVETELLADVIEELVECSRTRQLPRTPFVSVRCN